MSIRRAVTLLAALAVLTVPTTALGSLPTLFPADGDYGPNDSFRSDDALYALGLTDLGGGKICVVPPGTTQTGDLSCKDKASPWASPNRVIGIGTFYTPIQGPYLRTGEWRLLGDGDCVRNGDDECVAGTTATDSLSETFTVRSCEPNCDPTIAQAQLNVWKAWAGGPLGTGTKAFCAAGTLYDAYGDLPGRRARRASTSIQAARKVGDFIADGSSAKTGTVQAVLKEASGRMTFQRRQTLAELTVTQFIQSELDGLRSAYNDAMIAIGTDIACKQKEMLADIVADPPDANFQTVQQPQFESWPTTYNALGDELVDAFETFNAYGKAQRIAAERYQGAVAADNAAGIHRQALAVQNFGDQMVLAMRRMSSALRRYQNDLNGSGGGTTPLITQADKNTLLELYQRVRTTGFTAAEQSQLQALGLTPAMIATFKSSFDKDMTALPVNTSLAGVVGQFEVALRANEAGLQTMSNAAANAAAASNSAPDAAFTANKTTGKAPLTVQFADTSSDPDGDTFTASWDWGDGTAEGTGLSPTHSFTAPGTYTVTETVTDGADSDTATKQIKVIAPTPPTAVFTYTKAGQHIDVDATASSDPDGTITGYDWNWGDGSAHGTGVTAGHTYPAGTATYIVTLTLTDDDGSTSTATRTIEIGGNDKPFARFTSTTTKGFVETNGSTSSDPDGTIVNWGWEWGDGGSNNSAAATSSHNYAADGTYTIRLTVTDNGGKTDFVERQVTVDVNDAPNANDDSFPVAGVDAFDVMANDSDQENEDIALTDTAQPAHGTVTCQRLGGCLYRAAGGYTGPDSFQYTITDPSGLTDTATVTLNVTPKAATVGALVALDDDLSVRSPAAGTVNVLANDVSANQPLHVVSETQPSHGTATCDHTNVGASVTAGTCTYTPAANHKGGDGFTYVVSDGIGQTRTATVRVIVADAATSVGVKAAGAPDPVVEGSEAQWKVGAQAGPDEVSGQALRGIQFPSLSATVSGPHTLLPDSVSTAKGWSTPGLGSTTSAPGPNALLGEAASAVIPKPTVINQGTGGDGDVPILVGSKVFAFFHHSNPTAVTCVDRSTGQLCPGYPRAVSRQSTNNNGPGAVVGAKIYTRLILQTPYGFSQRGSIALYCWDTAKDEPCGLFVVARTKNGGQGASAPWQIAGKLWISGDEGKFYCLDPDTGEPCAGGPIASGLPSQVNAEYDLISHGTRLYTSSFSGSLVGCLDVATRARCAGWDSAKDFGSGRFDLMNRYDTDGHVDGICAVAPGSARCLLDTKTDIADSFDLPNFITGWSNYWDITQEAETGTRTFHPSNNGYLHCWDWSTNAACAGPEFSSPGLLSGPGIERSYGATFDGTCVVGLGDPGNVFTVDTAGRRPCTSLSTGARRTIDLRDQRCDGTVGAATWKRVQLTDAEAGDFTELDVIIRDAATGEVLATGDLVGAPVSLAGIDPKAHPRITVDSSGKSTSGNPAWSDAIYPRIDVVWDSDPKQLCFQTTTTKDCLGPLTPLSITATLGAGPASDEASVALLRADCPPVAGRAEATLDEGTALDLDLEATDPRGGSPTYQLKDPPPGLTVNPATGKLSWTPTEAQGPGDYEVGYTATAGGAVTRARRGTSSDTVTLHVNEVNTAPQLTEVADRTAAPGEAVSVALAATDADLPANGLSFTLVSGPAGATIDAATGVVRWTAGGTGPQRFTVRVTDDGAPALSAERTFAVTLPAAPSPTPSAVPVPSPTATPPAGETAAEQVLGCADRKVVLEDVVPVGRRVQLVGVADRAFAGRTVTVVFGPRAKKVATATVRADGSFSASAPLPARGVRATNAARYQARVGGERSLSLKLQRRMRITTISATAGMVRIAGRVELPLALKVSDRVIKLQQVVNCKRAETIRRLTPRRNGRFSVTVPAPSGQRAAVYRLQTRVRRNRHSKRIVNTYTLPRAVDFG